MKWLYPVGIVLLFGTVVVFLWGYSHQYAPLTINGERLDYWPARHQTLLWLQYGALLLLAVAIAFALHRLICGRRR